jgi:type I restriction enzyme R subunit
MQAIARTNRKFEGKSCGFIVDYINVFKYIKKALAEYATGDDGLLPAKDVEYLIKMLESTIDEGNDYLSELGIDLDDIANTEDTLERLEKSRKALDIIVDKDDYKDRFKVITNTMINLYEASKPEILELGWRNERFMVLDYIHGLLHNTIDDEKIKRAKARMDQLLDSSVESNTLKETSEEYIIHEGKVIDLSKIDAEKLKEEIRQAEYKAIEIDDLKEYLDKALKEMTDKNCTRIAFSERFKNIIDAYNAGGMQNEEYYEQLLKFVDDLKNEQNRANTEGLTEEELEIFDLLVKDKKLTKAEEQKVKLAAKNLYIKLTTERDNLLVVDWYKDEQPKLKVKDAIEKSLDGDLPETYDRVIFSSKVMTLLNHFIDMAVQAYGWIANKV